MSSNIRRSSKPEPPSPWGRLLLEHVNPWLIIVGLWTLFIWSRSLYPGVDSRAQSTFVLGIVRPLFEAVGLSDTDTMTFIIRKTAHFLEYTVLGMLLALAGYKKSAWPQVFYGVAVPCIDETIQLFVPERSGQLTDVALDCAGVAFGWALVTLVHVVRGNCSRPK